MSRSIKNLFLPNYDRGARRAYSRQFIRLLNSRVGPIAIINEKNQCVTRHTLCRILFHRWLVSQTLYQNTMD